MHLWLLRAPHTHWVWSARYNQSHDQLVLSAGSDCRVVLSNMASLSSDLYGDVEPDDDDEDDVCTQPPLSFILFLCASSCGSCGSCLSVLCERVEGGILLLLRSRCMLHAPTTTLVRPNDNLQYSSKCLILHRLTCVLLHLRVYSFMAQPTTEPTNPLRVKADEDGGGKSTPLPDGQVAAYDEYVFCIYFVSC